MKTIMVGHGKVARIDDEDVMLVLNHSWHLNKYAYTAINKKQVSMARLILGIVDCKEPDHIDLDKLNNCRSNLRTCSRLENSRHRGIFKSNTSGYKGVVKANKKWRAYINVNGNRIHLGVYDTPELAAAAYDQAALQYFGDFALTNAMMRGESVAKR